MKTRTILIALASILLLALTTCKKDPQPIMERFDLSREDLTIGTTSASIVGTYAYSGAIDEITVCVSEDGVHPTTFLADINGKNFSVEMTGLRPATSYQYYYSVDYGFSKPFTTEAKTFTTLSESPTVRTIDVMSIDSTTVRVNCETVSDGGVEITERGVCWNTYGNPNLDDSNVAYSSGGLGEYSCRIGGLSPSTRYYVRAYAKNASGIGFGEVMVFLTDMDALLPSVTTEQVSNITQTTAMGGGNVLSEGSAAVIERGICWGTSHNPTISGSHAYNGTGTGGYTVNMTGLTAKTHYYVRAYAKNSAGVSYGNEVDFTTPQNVSAPTVTTSQVTNVQQTTATGGGNVTNSGGATVTERGICWSTSHNPTTSGSHASNGTGTGSFTVNMTGLTANTTYYVRAYATNSAGTAYGSEVSFSTSQIPSYTISVSASPSSGGTVTGGGTYQQGQSCTVHATANSGYTFFNWTEGGSQVSANANYTFTVTGNRILVAHFTYNGGGNAPQGAINGKFTINANGDQVYFSQGNLQYIGSAAMPYWKFADNQWDVLGTTTGQNSSNQNVDRDLFGWGTSGWNNGNTYYRPWDTNNSDGSLYGPLGYYNLTGSYANSDWGYYNAISNGGNQNHQWRTLTSGEWVYVFNTRSTASGIRYAKANVNNVNGVILLPDDWSASYYSLSNTNQNGASFGSNVISSTQWSTLEQHGAVFLPAAGYRNGTSVGYVGSYGYYWSASYYSSVNAYLVGFVDSFLNPQYSLYRFSGRSVRLVRSAQ